MHTHDEDAMLRYIEAEPEFIREIVGDRKRYTCLLYTSPSPRDCS